MPGAASGRAAGFLSTIAPKDGTVIAAIMPGAVMGPLLDEKAEVLFDPTKVQYLGTANNGTRVCVSFADTPTKTAFWVTISLKVAILAFFPAKQLSVQCLVILRYTIYRRAESVRTS